MATITCSLCRRSFEAGPDHCPHCHLRLPGAPRQAPPARRAAPSSARTGESRPRVRRRAPAVDTVQCPACAHPITRDDQWCKWCKWPVNR